VGENGSGKSTLLEGIAVAAELPAMGATGDAALDPTLAHAERLGAALRLGWSPRSRQGFFLRAEDFFGRVKGLARQDARIIREKAEALADVPADAPRVVGGSHPDELAASPFLKRYDSRSHGESFMDLFAERVRPRGLYLLDEPEAPLSPKRQIEFLGALIRAAKADAQFIIATHSPILLACPGARILTFDRVPITGVAYMELEHVTVSVTSSIHTCPVPSSTDPKAMSFAARETSSTTSQCVQSVVPLRGRSFMLSKALVGDPRHRPASTCPPRG